MLVCGGRDYADANMVEYTLGNLKRDGLVIVEGGAPGADTLARNWARRNGVEVRTFHADWKKHGRGAGPIRNQRMLDEALPEMAIGFPGGRGTADMLRRAEHAGLAIIMVPA